MIAMIREKALLHGWLTEEALMNLIAVSESTPGPIAVNMATFVGSSEGGALGALAATLGVVLPSFIIMLVIVAFANGLLRYKGVSAFLRGVRPAVVAMIIATAITMLMRTLISFDGIGDKFAPDPFGIALFVFIALFAFVFKRLRKSPPSPILLILIYAGTGMLLFS